MSQPRRILPFAIVALLIGVIGWQLYATREPSYQGKTLFKWLEDLEDAKPEEPAKASQARAAIRAIGTNGLPTLLWMVQAQDSAPKRKLMEWARHQSVVDFHFTPAMKIRVMVVGGFGVLGSDAKDAIPALTALLPDSSCGPDAAECLVKIGAEAIPILRHGLTNGNAWLRMSCLAGLHSAGTNGWAALPEILSCLHDSNWIMRYWAVPCLRHYQHDSATVLPVLWQTAQQDQNVSVRRLSIQALGFYGDQASAYVPGLQKLLLSTNKDDLPQRLPLTNALKNIDPTAWPNGGAPPPADLPKDVP